MVSDEEPCHFRASDIKKRRSTKNVKNRTTSYENKHCSFEWLVRNLSDEFRKMARDMEDLTAENSKLRSENFELSAAIASKMNHVGQLKQASMDKEHQSVMDLAVDEDSTQIVDLYMAESTGLKRNNTENNAEPSEETVASRSFWTSSMAGGTPVPLAKSTRFAQEAVLPLDCPCTESTSQVKYLPGDMPVLSPGVGAELANQCSGEEVAPMLTQDQILSSLFQQFDRLDKDKKGVLTIQDLFDVVSDVENQKYGHVKHEYKRIFKTMQNLKRTTGGAVKVSVPGTVELQRLEATPESSTEVVMDFELFQSFMLSDDYLDTISVGEDATYLRKAFEWEAHLHLTNVTKQQIATRRRQMEDPMPSGITRVILETLPPLVISCNALVIGLSADITSIVWDIFEKCFLSFYLMEFVLKMRILGCKRYFRGSEGHWNIFDGICLSTGLFDLSLEIYFAMVQNEGADTTLLPLLKVVRLARLARIVRSFRYKIFEDLKSMVSGVWSGARVLGWSIVLLFVVIYMLGVLMRQVVPSEPEFQNIPSAMFTVFRCFTDGCTSYSGAPLQERLRLNLEIEGYGGIFMVAYILMFLIVTVGVFNLIMAIFIDNVVSTTVKRKQQELGSREEEMKVNLQEMLIHLVRTATAEEDGQVAAPSRVSTKDKSAEGLEHRSIAAARGMALLRQSDTLITRDLFNTWLTDLDMLALLDDMDIDTATKFEIFDVCDVDKSGSLTADELVSGLLRLRGPISKCDIIAVRLKVRYLTDMLEDIHQSLNL